MPGELLDAAREAVPGLNISGVLQEALRDLLECSHETLACARCAAQVSRRSVVDTMLTRFYGEMQAAVGALVRRGGTAEGAARALRQVAVDWRLRLAMDTPPPRPTRAERQAAHVKELPTPRRRTVRPRRGSAGETRGEVEAG